MVVEETINGRVFFIFLQFFLSSFHGCLLLKLQELLAYDKLSTIIEIYYRAIYSKIDMGAIVSNYNTVINHFLILRARYSIPVGEISCITLIIRNDRH